MALLVFLAIISLPVWIFIILIKKLKPKKFLSWLKIIVATILIVIVIKVLFSFLSSSVLNVINQQYGLGKNLSF